MTYPYREPMRMQGRKAVPAAPDPNWVPAESAFTQRLTALEAAVNSLSHHQEKIVADLIAQRDYWHTQSEAQGEVIDDLLKKLAAVEDLIRQPPQMTVEVANLAVKILKVLA